MKCFIVSFRKFSAEDYEQNLYHRCVGLLILCAEDYEQNLNHRCVGLLVLCAEDYEHNLYHCFVALRNQTLKLITWIWKQKSCSKR